MPNLSFNSLLQELAYGRELEFSFQGVKYAISLATPAERCFTVFYPQLSVKFSSLDNLLSNVTISGQTIEEIWPHILDYTLF